MKRWRERRSTICSAREGRILVGVACIDAGWCCGEFGWLGDGWALAMEVEFGYVVCNGDGYEDSM